ncbi:MAG: proline iminopeptidase-family hydrolase [Rhodococcus sp.]|nr:proline iminopeptidase-family hydrolase [Rhodococcus sp. (in: high G+C Gram-positive bacteria)]
MSIITEGVVPFAGGFTWYRVTTPRELDVDAAPLVVLHGGPGMAHDYVRNIAELADETGRVIVHYDQIGCGRSDHLPDVDRAFWTPGLFVDEFFTMIDHLGYDTYHVLGQSWGGMLGAEIAVTKPAGLISLAICNSPASMQLWLGGAAQLRRALPPGMQDALDVHEREGTFGHPDYVAAVAEFYRRHVCRLQPMPQDFLDSEAQMIAEPTVYHTMNGPNEFHVIGTMRNWTVIDRLERIEAPTLVIAGEYDEATPATWQPFVDKISGARAQVFPGASHCTHLEQPAEFRAVVAAFLAEHDTTRQGTS